MLSAILGPGRRKGGLWGFRTPAWGKYSLPVSDSQEQVEKRHIEVPQNDELLIQKIASNELIVENIFRHAPVPDLLSCSLACKSWCGSARRILRKHKRCLARLRHVDDHQGMLELSKLLQESNDLPFSGLCIKCETWFAGYPYPQIPPMTWEDFLKLLNSRIPNMKHLSIDFGFRVSPDTVRGIEFLLLGLSAHIEWLSVRALDVNNQDFLNDESIVSLPNLRQLDLPCWPYPNSLSDKLLLSAPKLKILEAPVTPQWLNPVVLGKASAVQEFRFIPNQLYLPRVLEFSMCRPKLVKLNFTGAVAGQFLEAYWTVEARKMVEVLCNLLTSSCYTLRDLTVDILPLIHALEAEPAVLAKLQNFHIDFSQLGFDSNGPELLGSRLNFEKYFPTVQRLEVTCDPPMLTRRRTTQHPSPVRLRRGHFVCESVQTLIFSVHGSESSQTAWISELARMLPRVRSFCAKRCERSPNLLRELWKSWPETLEKLVFADLRTSDVLESWDSVLCGTNPADLPRIVKAKRLQSYPHVPNGPSILDMKVLKTFMVELNYDTDPLRKSRSGKCWISEVGGALALARVPGLKFRVIHVVNRDKGRQTYWFNTSHLQDYVELESREAKICMTDFDL